jgi:hypothetical protein
VLEPGDRDSKVKVTSMGGTLGVKLAEIGNGGREELARGRRLEAPQVPGVRMAGVIF